MSDRSMRWGIGLFVLVSLALLGALIIMFGSLPTMFKRSNIYTIRFVDAPGVGPGTPVRRSGVRIGEVRDVLLDDERGIVRVQVAIDPRYSLRRNEQPILNIGLLGSDASIDFVPASAENGEAVDRSALEPGSELVGVRPANVNTLLNRASEVAPTAQETLAEIRRSLQRLERMSPLAEETMKEYRDLAKDVRRQHPRPAPHQHGISGSGPRHAQSHPRTGAHQQGISGPGQGRAQGHPGRAAKHRRRGRRRPHLQQARRTDQPLGAGQ